MPRKPVISRTITFTTCKCLMIDLKKMEQLTNDYEIRGDYTRQQINKKGDKLFNNSKLKFITCLKVKSISKNFEMPIDEFIRLADIKK